MQAFEDIPLGNETPSATNAPQGTAPQNIAPQNIPAIPSTTPPTFSPFSNPPSKRASSAGPLIGIVIIVFLLLLGGLYFWGAHLNAQSNGSQPLPAIPADNSTTSAS